MRRKWVVSLLLGMIVVGFFLPRGASVRPSQQAAQTDPVSAMLLELRDHGFVSTANGGNGGLAAQWAAGGAPTSTFDPTLAPGDALLVNAYYLHALWLFTLQHPTDTRFLAERTRATTLLKAAFPRGHLLTSQWFMELHDLAALSHDPWYSSAVRQLVMLADQSLYHPMNGAVYWTDPQHPTGWYRSAAALEIAAAFVVEGQQDHQQQWVHDGLQALAFLNVHAYFPLDHLYFGAMSHVLSLSGDINPNEALASDSGATIASTDIAREALALSTMAQVMNDAVLRTRATDLLDQMTPEQNALHLWDDQHQGFYHAVVFSGSDYQHPGAPSVLLPNKYPADQAFMLRALILVGHSPSQRSTDLRYALQQVLLGSAYQENSHGMVVQMMANWHVLPTSRDAWLDSTTMTIALISLLSVAAVPLPSLSPTTPSAADTPGHPVYQANTTHSERVHVPLYQGEPVSRFL